MERIGIRELRQHASRYVARVARGEELEVTDRGRPVARLVPIGDDRWSRMVSAGTATVAADTADLTDEGPVDYGVDASAGLADLRSDER